MMQAAAYGRLGQDPRQLETRTGTLMVVGSLAVDVSDGRDAEEEAPPLWLGLVAFGRVAEDLLRHSKGELLSVSGRVQRRTWTDKTTGEEREQLQVVADSIVSARSVRPSGRSKAKVAESPGEAAQEIPF